MTVSRFAAPVLGDELSLPPSKAKVGQVRRTGPSLNGSFHAYEIKSRLNRPAPADDVLEIVSLMWAFRGKTCRLCGTNRQMPQRCPCRATDISTGISGSPVRPLSSSDLRLLAP
jgi:hypothetical protein